MWSADGWMKTSHKPSELTFCGSDIPLCIFGINHRSREDFSPTQITVSLQCVCQHNRNSKSDICSSARIFCGALASYNRSRVAQSV
jgi:hypothetical protein